MNRNGTEGGRLRVCIPSCFVIPPIRPPEPPPIPGTVRPEDVRPPADPPLPFLRAWEPFRRSATFEVTPQTPSDLSVPCEVDESLIEQHQERHHVRSTIEAAFRGHDPAIKQRWIEAVTSSLASPFCSRAGNSIVWTLRRCIMKNPPAFLPTSAGKKSTHKHDRLLHGLPWSIVSFGEERGGTTGWPGMVRRNIIYDGNGDAIAQVDFGHGDFAGVHSHALVVGALDHTPGSADDHMFPLESTPWFWTLVPDARSARMQHKTRNRCLGLDSEDDNDGSEEADGDTDLVSRADVLGGRADAAVFDRQRGTDRFGLADTAALDDCSWAAINVPFEDYGE